MPVQLYGSESRLSPNKLYTLTLNVPGVESFRLQFTSRYSPLYASAKVVRSDTGDLLMPLTDDQIYFAIWLASRDGEDLLIRKALVQERPTEHDQRLEIDRYLNDPRNRQARYAFEQYVRYRANIDLITAAYLSQSAASGQLQKKLGQLTILRESRPANLPQMMGNFREQLAQWEDRLMPSKTLVAGAVRGGRRSPYPLAARRSF